MNRKKVSDQPDIDLFETGLDELDSVLAGLPGNDQTICLFRVNPQGGPAYITEFSPDDWSIEAVKNTYGGGKYKFVAKSDGVVRKTGTFQIEGEPLHQSKPVYKRFLANGKLVYSKPGEADLVEVPPQAEKRESSTADSNVSLLLGSLLERLSNLEKTINQQSQPNSKRDFLEELQIYKNLFSQPPPNPIDNFPKMAVDLLTKGMEIANAGEGGGSPWMMILDKVLPTLQDVLKVVTTQQAREPLPMPRTNPQILPQSEPSKPTETLTGFASISGDLQAYLPTFLRAASMGTDPNIMVDLTANQIPEDKKQVVIDWLKGDSWLSDLFTLHPMIQGQMAWWQEFGFGLKDILENPDSPETEDHENVQ